VPRELHRLRLLVTKDAHLVTGLDARQFVVWNGPDLGVEFSSSLRTGAVCYYEIAFEGKPSPTHLVKVQVDAASRCGPGHGVRDGVRLATTLSCWDGGEGEADL